MIGVIALRAEWVCDHAANANLNHRLITIRANNAPVGMIALVN